MSRLPRLRSDLEITTRLVEGEPLQYLIRDPHNDKIYAYGDREYFICQRLDGQTPFPDIQDAFYQQFNLSLDLLQLEAFVRHLASLQLVEYNLEPQEISWHFPVYYKKHTLGNPDRWMQKLAVAFSWCFNRTFAIGLGLLFLLALILFVTYFNKFHREVVNLLWNPGPFFLETLIGILFINVVGELGKAIALKHYAGNVPEACVGLAYRLVPTFHFDLSDLYMRKKPRQQVIFSAGLVAQLFFWCIGIIAWKITYPWTMMHKFWVIFTVAAQFFFLINLIPLLPRDGYYLLSNWLEVPDLWNRSRDLVKAWFYRHPLPEPLTPREQLGFKIFGGLSIVFLFSFWLVVLGLLGYLLIWHWKLKGLGACLFLTILGLRYGDAMKQIGKMFFSPRNHLAGQEGFIRTKPLIKLGMLAIVIIIFLIPYPFEAGGEFKLWPINQLSIRAVVSGEITKVLVEEGQWVKKGQTLALLLDKDYRARLDSFREALNANLEKLTWMRKGPKPQEVAKAEQEVKLAAKALQYSSVEATRYTKMYQEKAVSNKDYMDALKARDEDRERLALAKKNLEVVKNPYRPEEIKAQEAEVRRLEAEVTLAEKNLQLTEILSPQEGRLITAAPLQKVGQYLDVGDLLGVVEDSRTFIAEIEVPEEDIEEVKPGGKVKLRTWAYPRKTFQGKVMSVAPTGYDESRKRVMRVLTEKEFRTMQVVPEQGRVIRVVSQFPNTDGLLRSDMTGYAKIEGAWMPLGVAFTRWLVRLVMVEIWSWIP
jgi:putative peptide zinc metalloprotease protein